MHTDISRQGTKNGFKFVLTRFFLISGYVQISIDIFVPEGISIVNAILNMEGTDYIRVSVENKISFDKINIDGLLIEKSEIKFTEPPSFFINILHSEGQITLTNLELLNTYAGQYNPVIAAFWDWVKSKPSGKFLEIGGRGETSSTVRSRMPEGWEYYSFDIHPGDNVDIVGDVHLLSTLVELDSFDVVYSSSVFEHISHPWLAVIECNKVLKLGGIMFTATHNCWPSHAEPWDFWRFTDSSWESLFNEVTGFNIDCKSVYEEVKIVPIVMSINRPQIPGARGGWLGVSCIAKKIRSTQSEMKYSIVSGSYPKSAISFKKD